MIKNAIRSLIRKALFLAIGLGVLLVIGFFASDRKDYPGKAQFEKVNSLISTGSGGTAHGDSDETRAAATAFAASMKMLQAAAFSGGSGRSLASCGEFVTYVKRTPNAVVILCHVPELRNYKDDKARETLSLLAWTAGQTALAQIPGLQDSDTLIIGLRGFASYGPIWEGTVSGEATRKTDELDEKKRLYPFFIEGGKAA
ncbi:MAG: hypothetical protein V4726_21580 [Verrucomicrobiota bacterium]